MLKNSQYKTAGRGVYKVVGVFDTIADALKIFQFANGVIGEKFLQFIFFDGGVNRHLVWL